MFGIGDLFQWDRFVTPTVIKVFYWLAVVISRPKHPTTSGQLRLD